MRAFSARDLEHDHGGPVAVLETVLTDGGTRAQVIGFRPVEGGVSLTDAAIIVSGGRGLGGPEGPGPVRELAD